MFKTFVRYIKVLFPVLKSPIDWDFGLNIVKTKEYKGIESLSQTLIFYEFIIATQCRRP